jgi:hypothetical protein
MLKEFGQFVGATKLRSNPNNLEFYKTACETLDDNFDELGKTIAKGAYHAFCVFGKQASAAALHMKQLSEQEVWYPEFNEPVHTVLETISNYHQSNPQLQKKAFLDWFPGGTIGDIGGLALASALLTGGIGGTALWGINRDTAEEEEDMEEMRARITAYNELVDRMESDLSEKYKYNEVPGEQFAE